MIQFIHDDDGYHMVKHICYSRLVGMMKYTIIKVKTKFDGARVFTLVLRFFCFLTLLHLEIINSNLYNYCRVLFLPVYNYNTKEQKIQNIKNCFIFYKLAIAYTYL